LRCDEKDCGRVCVSSSRGGPIGLGANDLAGGHDDVVRSVIETALLGNLRDIGADLNTIRVWIKSAVRRYHDQISKTIALVRLS
jgi:hypothetical protein